jgi:hypothetical protein
MAIIGWLSSGCLVISTCTPYLSVMWCVMNGVVEAHWTLRSTAYACGLLVDLLGFSPCMTVVQSSLSYRDLAVSCRREIQYPDLSVLDPEMTAEVADKVTALRRDHFILTCDHAGVGAPQVGHLIEILPPSH